MERLFAAADGIGARLKARGETIAVAESSTGGLVAAALLAVPGASAYFLGGAVVYTAKARAGLLDIGDLPAGIRAASEPYALLLARTIRARLGADWALAETGASGPTGNRYGDAAGHCCIAAVGRGERALTIETGSADRHANMEEFAAAALTLLGDCLG